MGLIPEDVIQQVIDRTDIVEFIGSYVPLKRAGRNFKGACPFHHEKTPSFVVTPDKGIFHCFGCHAGGNIIGFLMKHERLDFVEAIRVLAERAGIIIPESSSHDQARESLRQAVFKANEAAVAYYHNNLMSGKEPEVKAARDYLKNRAVGPECAKKFYLGYAYGAWDGLVHELKSKGFSSEVIEKSGLVVPREKGGGYYDRFRGRLIFSIFDYRGRPVAFGARALGKDDKAKYINSPETPVYTKGRHCYGLHWSKDALARADAAIIVEGYMDFLRPFDAGVENVVASLGTALTVDQIRLVRRYTRNVVMLFDMDTAGQTAALRSLDILLAEDMSVRVAALADDEDPDSFILKQGVDAFRQRIREARSLFDFKLGLLMAAHNAQTIEGRATICQEILPTIDKIPSEVVREGYLRELAVRLSVSEEALRKERERLSNKRPHGQERVHEEPKAVPPRVLSADESLLISLMLLNSRWIVEAKVVLSPDELQDETIRMIVGKIYELFDAGKEVTAAALVGRMGSASDVSALTGLAANDGLKDEQRAFNDCLKRIKDARLKTERRRLREEIARAEQAGDWDAVRRSQERFNTLIKG